MTHRLRTILAVRAAGLVVVGLALPEIASGVHAMLQGDGLLGLRHGHPGAIVGIVGVFFAAFLDAIDWYLAWALIMLMTGIAMVALNVDRMRRLVQYLEHK